jgi:hypothetical protein
MVETTDADELIDEWDEVKETFSDGGRVVSVPNGYRGPDLPDGMQGGVYYVPAETPDGHHDWKLVRGSYRHNERERKAMLTGQLQARTGCLDGGESIPVSVATDGQKAIAAYLWAVKGWDRDVIANKMGKAESTVGQYISDYKAGRFD